jgi:RNA polymerase sigma-54 factor
VADAIVARQRGFFEYGEVAMKPLTLKLIAGELGLHESTVCRVTNNKYMATPRGLFEFKHFFSRRLATDKRRRRLGHRGARGDEGADRRRGPARAAVGRGARRLLAQQGLRVARRTITKYRALMRMPSVDVRRADNRSAS